MRKIAKGEYADTYKGFDFYVRRSDVTRIFNKEGWRFGIPKLGIHDAGYTNKTECIAKVKRIINSR